MSTPIPTDTGTSGEVTKTEVTETETAKLPDDHPLVKTLAAQKSEIKDLRAKAKRLDEIEEAAKTKEEKDADRVAKAEAEAASVPAKVAEALKEHLVVLHKFDAEDAELFLTASEPELLLKQVSRLLDRTTGTRKKNIVAREGENHSAEATSDMREFTRQLFGSET